MDWTPVEYPPPPIDYGPDVYGPGKLGAFCERLPRITFDPRHPRCYCGRFIRPGAHACSVCGCDCWKCSPWSY